MILSQTLDRALPATQNQGFNLVAVTRPRVVRGLETQCQGLFQGLPWPRGLATWTIPWGCLCTGVLRPHTPLSQLLSHSRSHHSRLPEHGPRTGPLSPVFAKCQPGAGFDLCEPNTVADSSCSWFLASTTENLMHTYPHV